MRHKFFFLSVAVLFLSVFGLSTKAFATPATTTTFAFTGACEDCYDGMGNGTATLVLTDYDPGTSLSADNLVSFTYNGTDLLSTFSIVSGDQGSFSGNIGSTTGQYNFFISGYSAELDDTILFATFQGGFWCTGQDCVADYGFTHDWSLSAPSVSATPEPGSMALLGTGIAGVASLRRRFRRA